MLYVLFVLYVMIDVWLNISTFVPYKLHKLFLIYLFKIIPQMSGVHTN